MVCQPNLHDLPVISDIDLQLFACLLSHSIWYYFLLIWFILFTGLIIRMFFLRNYTLYAIAIPPLAEQKRIVAKLEELLPLCERLK